MTTREPPIAPPPQLARPSASLAASNEEQRRRIAAMTPMERMALALELGRVVSELQRAMAPKR